MSIIFSILGALWQSQAGRMVIIAIIAGAVGYHKGYQKGDEGRIALKAEYEAATKKLLSEEALRAKRIVEESSKEAADHDAEMAEKDRLLEEANKEIEKLEAGNKQCGFVSRATVRRLNSSR